MEVGNKYTDEAIYISLYLPFYNSWHFLRRSERAPWLKRIYIYICMRRYHQCLLADDLLDFDAEVDSTSKNRTCVIVANKIHILLRCSPKPKPNPFLRCVPQPKIHWCIRVARWFFSFRLAKCRGYRDDVRRRSSSPGIATTYSNYIHWPIHNHSFCSLLIVVCPFYTKYWEAMCCDTGRKSTENP